jgi:hypothetical protein
VGGVPSTPVTSSIDLHWGCREFWCRPVGPPFFGRRKACFFFFVNPPNAILRTLPCRSIPCRPPMSFFMWVLRSLLPANGGLWYLLIAGWLVMPWGMGALGIVHCADYRHNPFDFLLRNSGQWAGAGPRAPRRLPLL